jgi:hypothetical protein
MQLGKALAAMLQLFFLKSVTFLGMDVPGRHN